MSWLEALILGVVQGLTEYLPVSSSGHLVIGSYFLGLQGEENLTFTIVVHVATVLSTVVVLWKEIAWLISGVVKFRMNDEMRYALNIVVSMIPIAVVGFCFKDTVEEVFGSGIVIVGLMLVLTAVLLAFAHYAPGRQRENISPLHAFIIGVAQACAVMPGLSRSGTTIAAGLLLGNKKETLAQFSFLMVIPPIVGEALLDALKIVKGNADVVCGAVSPTALIVGFVAAFVSGCFACRVMVNLVKKGKLIYFAAYCAVVGAALLIAAI